MNLNPLNLNLSDPNVVVINGNAINTTATDSVSLNASGSEFIYINVQGDVISNNDANQLSNLGVKILKTIGNHVFLARYPNSDLDAVRRLPFVRAANVYGPSLKTVGSLKKKILDGLPSLNLQVVVLLQPNAPQSAEQVAQEIGNRLGLNLLDSLAGATSAIQLTVRPDQLYLIESIDSVRRIEEYLPIQAGNEYARGVLGLNWDYSSVGYTKESARWKGRGEVVCVADTGVDVGHRAFLWKIHSERNLFEPYKSMKATEDYNGHGTHCAGSVVEGVAQECKIMVQCMLKGEDIKGMYDTELMYADAFENGAMIHTDSWCPGFPGSQPPYNYSAEWADKALTWNEAGTICICAGNEGGKNSWNGEIGGNGASKNAIVVGNGITLRPNDGNGMNLSYPTPDPRMVASSSSTGNTLAVEGYEGRIKPDVIAPGTAILSCKSRQITAEQAKSYEPFGYSWRSGYMYSSGTSMATPHVAGCCAVIREALRSPNGGGFTKIRPSGMLIKALLVNGCIDLKGHYGGSGSYWMNPAPSPWQGFGRVDLTNSLLHIERVAAQAGNHTGFMDASHAKPYSWCSPLSQGQYYESGSYTVDAKVFSVTLVYFDPGDEAPQNQLNLTVYNGDGYNNWWRGNQWYRQQGNGDRQNNVEKVTWVKTENDTNQFRIRVDAVKVTGDPGTVQSYAVAWLAHE